MTIPGAKNSLKGKAPLFSVNFSFYKLEKREIDQKNKEVPHFRLFLAPGIVFLVKNT